MSARAQRRLHVGRRGDVPERGTLRFTFEQAGAEQEGFIVRFRGRVYAYLNLCAHVNLKLDQGTGQFFGPGAGALRCLNHGATFDPVTGRGLAGPARGRFLKWLAIREEGDDLWVVLHEAGPAMADPGGGVAGAPGDVPRAEAGRDALATEGPPPGGTPSDRIGDRGGSTCDR